MNRFAMTLPILGLLALIIWSPTSRPVPVPLALVASRNACSLTQAQQRRALDAFDQLLPVVEHPRCMNCHGGVNPYLDRAQGRHLGGRQTDSVTGQPLSNNSCQECHGLLPGWDLPGEAMFFVGKSPTDLCKQFKAFAPGGGAEFVKHIELEPGLPHFIKQGFAGDRALNALGEVTYEEQMGRPPTPERPPGNHPQFVTLAQNWVDAIGEQNWNASPDCGCTLSGSWSGTVTARGDFVGTPANITFTASAIVVFEQIPTPSYSSGRRVRNYKATGGIVTWNALASGQCRGGAGGSMPLDTLDTDGHPLAELRLEETDNASTTYQPTTSSWPDRWSPMFNVYCLIDGRWFTFPMTNLLGTWWHYDIPNPPVSADPARLKGSYRQVSPGATLIWTWDLRHMP